MADWMADGWPVLWMRGAITRLACKHGCCGRATPQDEKEALGCRLRGGALSNRQAVWRDRWGAAPLQRINFQRMPGGKFSDRAWGGSGGDIATSGCSVWLPTSPVFLDHLYNSDALPAHS